MGRLAWSQLRFRTVRLLALLAGMLLATTAFTVLTAASRTGQLRTVGTVSAHFAPAYDILVRPSGTRTRLETQTGTVQPNFLSGIYGGITMARYHQIENIPGVQVAAPVAMAGYTLLAAPIRVPIPAADRTRAGRQLYRVSTTWVSGASTSRIQQPASYVYNTPNPLRLSPNLRYREILTGGTSVPVCSSLPVTRADNPFGTAAQSTMTCWSMADGPGTGFPQA